MPTNIMPHVGKATIKQQGDRTPQISLETNSDNAKKKKKRPRIRIRPRNKCCKLANQELAVVESEQTIVEYIRELREPDVANSSTMEPLLQVPPMASTELGASKTRDQIMAEREAKKLAKQAKKTKVAPVANNVSDVQQLTTFANPSPAKSSTIVKDEQHAVVTAGPIEQTTEKTRDQVMAEREAKKLAKQAAKAAKVGIAAQNAVAAVTEQVTALKVTPTETVAPASLAAGEEKKKPALTKAERRAIQEAQRAAKAQAQSAKQLPVAGKKSAIPQTTSPSKSTATAVKVNISTAVTDTPAADAHKNQRIPTSPTKSPQKSNECKVKLFNHLASARSDVNLFINNPLIHPSIARLGEQYAKRTVVGSNARCIAFLNALKSVIHDFVTPPKKAFSRSLETTISHCVDHLQKCRPLAVSVVNAHKHIKHVLTQLPSDQPELELKENLCHFIDTYIENQIDKAAQAISSSMQEKISNGDVILTYGCSSLINFICEEAHRRHVDFRVIVVDSRPFCEGQELLRRLTNKAIPCTYVLINAIGFVMPEVTKVLLGAHALLSNGYVMGRVGTAQVALVAHSFNVPVLVCCETHKFSERFQTDAIVYNELGNPNDLVISDKCCLTNWQSKSKMSPLNLIYDITPSELVTAVVTEVSVLPCTSVPVILRIKPTEIGY